MEGEVILPPKDPHRLVRCPDAPCTERCIWCCGSGWIAQTTLAIYQMKKLADAHDTDRETKKVAPQDYAENDWALSQEQT